MIILIWMRQYCIDYFGYSRMFNLHNINTHNSNTAIHEKNYILRSSGVHPTATKMVQHMQIDSCDIPYKQNKG